MRRTEFTKVLLCSNPARFFCLVFGSEGAEVDHLSKYVDVGHVPKTAFAVSAPAVVARVFQIGCWPEIGDAVVERVAISVVDQADRPLAADVQPRQSMCHVSNVIDGNSDVAGVAAPEYGAGHCAWLDASTTLDLPPKHACAWVIVKQGPNLLCREISPCWWTANTTGHLCEPSTPHQMSHAAPISVR